jgi:hypothetical protein
VIRRWRSAGTDVREPGHDAARALHALEVANQPDYPVTPATGHDVPSLQGARAFWSEGGRVFGALDGTVPVAATVIERSSLWRRPPVVRPSIAVRAVLSRIT